MDGLGIVSSSSKSSRREGKRWNGDTPSAGHGKGKEVSSSSSSNEGATTYVVSKIDAGQAVLISDQVHCIEFPSILLPSGCTTGSIVSISCSRNLSEEKQRADEFWDLQDDILSSFGEVSPTPPSLRLRNVTQTSVTLEWDRLQLATAKLLSLTIWRNGQRLAAIPNPMNNTSTKVSGLDVDANYSFHLIVRTTAGTFSSQTIKTRTLTLSDTSGISVCFGAIYPPDLLSEAQQALEGMKARSSHRIQIETTHFVCTHAADGPTGPPPGSDSPNPAIEFQRATQLSIPIVHPNWVLACMREKKMVPISGHYLDKAALSGGPPSAVSLNRSNTSSQSRHAAQVPQEKKRQTPIQLQQPPRGRSSTAGSADSKRDEEQATEVEITKESEQTEEQVAAKPEATTVSEAHTATEEQPEEVEVEKEGEEGAMTEKQAEFLAEDMGAVTLKEDKGDADGLAEPESVEDDGEEDEGMTAMNRATENAAGRESMEEVNL